MMAAVLCGNGNVQFGHIPVEPVEEVVTTGKAGMSSSQLRQIKIHAPTGNANLVQVFHQEAHIAAYVQLAPRTLNRHNLSNSSAVRKPTFDPPGAKPEERSH